MLAVPAMSAPTLRAVRLPPIVVATDAANSLKTLRASVSEDI